MKRREFNLFVVCILIGILMTGCGKTDGGVLATGENAGATPSDLQSSDIQIETSAIPQATGDGKAVTSLQAAGIAYDEAVKWRSDAVLWNLQAVPSSLDANWTGNDLAGDWIVLFACKSDNKCFTVEILDNEVIKAAEETYTVRKIDVPESAPTDRPGISMKDAAAVAIKNGMPDSPANLMASYSIEHYTEEWNGKPVWEFFFTISNEAYCCAVDGLTGELLDVEDQNGNSVDLLKNQTEQEKPAGDASEAIDAFFALLDKGETEEALDMMLEAKLENSENKNGWEACFNDIESITVEKTEEFLKESWTEAHEDYKCTLLVALKPGAQPGLWESGEIIRYISVEAENGQWKISEISMNP